jgi:hypothetical protein
MRNGASLPEAKSLARHSDIKMTLRYTHIGINDQAKAVALIKMPKASEGALHGRCISGGTEGQSETLAGNTKETSKVDFANESKGIGIVSHGLSSKCEVPLAGLEPARGFPQQILNLLRLPFRHSDIARQECISTLLKKVVP